MLGRDSGGEPVLDSANIRNQIMTFLIAGQLTTSELMLTALYNLVHHPAVLSVSKPRLMRCSAPTMTTSPPTTTSGS
jgi:cytochrome P450